MGLTRNLIKHWKKDEHLIAIIAHWKKVSSKITISYLIKEELANNC